MTSHVETRAAIFQATIAALVDKETIIPRWHFFHRFARWSAVIELPQLNKATGFIEALGTNIVSDRVQITHCLDCGLVRMRRIDFDKDT